MHTLIRAGLCFSLILITPCGFAGDLQDARSAEIQHLIKYVSDSGCTFVRNGSAYSPAEAAAHIRKKYAYFTAEIDSTEKFIELSATQSTVTGRRYTVRCPGKEVVECRDWLLEELRVLRSRNGG